MTVRREHFVDAPADAELTPEGWLVYGQEAWTLADWLAYPSLRPGYSGSHKGRAYATAEEREAAKTESRRRWREANRRSLAT